MTASLDGASFRMDSQDQQEAEGVWLEGKERASFGMELQGKKEAEAGLVSGEVLVVSKAWPSGRNYLSSWSGQMGYWARVARGIGVIGRQGTRVGCSLGRFREHRNLEGFYRREF